MKRNKIDKIKKLFKEEIKDFFDKYKDIEQVEEFSKDILKAGEMFSNGFRVVCDSEKTLDVSGPIGELFFNNEKGFQGYCRASNQYHRANLEDLNNIFDYKFFYRNNIVSFKDCIFLDLNKLKTSCVDLTSYNLLVKLLKKHSKILCYLDDLIEDVDNIKEVLYLYSLNQIPENKLYKEIPDASLFKRKNKKLKKEFETFKKEAEPLRIKYKLLKEI